MEELYFFDGQPDVLRLYEIFRGRVQEEIRSRKSGKCGRKSKKPKGKRAAYAEQHPDVCRQTDADPETGCMEFDIEKGRFSFRLTAPYNEERREAARRYARENSFADGLK